MVLLKLLFGFLNVDARVKKKHLRVEREFLLEERLMNEVERRKK